MDSRSFDNWTRARAVTANRRKLLGWSLTAGVAGALSRVLPASAQFDGASGSCTYDIELTSSITAGATATGSLEFELADGGAIDAGSLTLQGQAAVPVVGQATGPAVDLLASLADGTVLSLTGIGSGPIAECPDALNGYLANAGTGQLGTWTASSTGSSSPTPTPTPQSGSSSTQPSGGGQSSNCPPTDCGSAFVLDQQSCQCVCAGGTVPCGANCCPSGSNCSDPIQGICGCPGGTTQCGTSCVPDCSGDEFLNLDTCQCEGNQEPACVDLGGGCANSGQCCSGWCNGGTCDSCSMRVCSDQCVDTLTDNNNCGNCNSPCIGTTCQNGSCQ
jgi:hypothetical protein